jgi:hypothetical protein
VDENQNSNVALFQTSQEYIADEHPNSCSQVLDKGIVQYSLLCKFKKRDYAFMFFPLNQT